MTLADKIKTLRKSLGLTQTELGNRVGVKKNAVSKWECGRVEDIPTSTLKALANLFDVPPSYLIDDSVNLSTHGVKIWSDDFRFSEQQKNKIIEYLAELALKQKELVTYMANAEKIDGKIMINSSLQGIVDDLSYWASIAVKYVNEDLSFDDNPFSEDNIREQYLSAIRRMSIEDQYRWLVRIQDYTEEHYPLKDEKDSN